MKKFILALILLSTLALWPFFKSGYFESHDGEWMVIRFTAFHQALSAGQFPVRFVDRLNNNYGYPVLNFLYPLPFYLAEIPKIAGLGFVDSVKTIFVFSTIVSTLAMFWALSQKFDKYSSFAGAIVYLFIPYRFVDLYVRGSLGENLAFTFIPLCLGAIFKIGKGNKIFLPLLSIFIALLILSHNVIALLFLPILITLSVIVVKKSRFYLVPSFCLGLLISAFFSFPAIYDLKYVNLPIIQIGNPIHHLANFEDLIIPKWGYGPNPGNINPLPVQIGIVPLIILASALFIEFSVKRTKEPMVKFLLTISIISIFFTSKASEIFWLNFRYSDLIQFPWRILSIVVFSTSLLIASIIHYFPSKRALAQVVVLSSILSTILYTKPLNFVNKGDSYYSTNEDTTTVRNEYLPRWVNKQKESRANQKILPLGIAKIENLKIKPANYQSIIESEKDIEVEVNTIYFPGWQVKVDNKITPINYSRDFGLINFRLPQGKHMVIIKYTETPVAVFSNIISTTAFLIAGISFLILWQKRNS